MKHVLLCDDDITVLRAAEIKLSRAGYRVTTYPDGQAAYEAIRCELPDMIISDCQMPRMGGLELVRKLREEERTRHVPFLMLTGKGFELPLEELRRDYGVLDVIGKPFSPKEVLRIVETTLAASAS